FLALSASPRAKEAHGGAKVGGDEPEQLDVALLECPVIALVVERQRPDDRTIVLEWHRHRGSDREEVRFGGALSWAGLGLGLAKKDGRTLPESVVEHGCAGSAGRGPTSIGLMRQLLGPLAVPEVAIRSIAVLVGEKEAAPSGIACSCALAQHALDQLL